MHQRDSQECVDILTLESRCPYSFPHHLHSNENNSEITQSTEYDRAGKKKTLKRFIKKHHSNTEEKTNRKNLEEEPIH